jgi:hypothetical protein
MLMNEIISDDGITPGVAGLDMICDDTTSSGSYIAQNCSTEYSVKPEE